MMLSPARSGRSAKSSTRATSTARATRRSTAPRSASTPRASRSTRSRSSTSSSERGELGGAGGRDAHPRARGARPGDRERRPLRAIVREMATLRGLIRAGGEIARLGWERPGERRRARRPGRADRLRPLAGPRLDRVQPHRGAAEGELRADHAALRGGRRRHRRAVRLPRPRPADVGLPARQPDHRRRAPEHGEVGARRSAWRRTSPSRTQHPGRAVHARDVEVRGDAAADVQRGEGRVAAAAHRQARASTTGPGSPRPATSSRRRRSTSTTPGSITMMEIRSKARRLKIAGAEPRPDRRRLPAADDLGRDASRTACRRSRRSRVS